MSEITKENPDITSTEKDKKHKFTISELFLYLKRDKNMYAKVLSKFRHREDASIETMAVGIDDDKKITFYYNPTWFQTDCTPVQAKTVIEHECLHITENQIPRYIKFEKTLHASLKSYLNRFRNIALDEAVNSRLSTWALPGDCIHPDLYNHLSGKSMEWYLRRWLEDYNNGRYTPKELDKTNKEANHKWLEDLDKLPESEKENLSGSIQRQTQRVLRQLHEEHLRTPKSKRGRLPNYFKQLFDELPEVNSLPWEAIFKQMIQASINTKEERSTSRINRRMLEMDVSPFPGKKQIPAFSILYAIDTSGSMSNDDIMKGLATVEDIITGCPELECTVLEFDCDLQRTYDLKGGRKKPDNIVYGRGGTDFNVPFKWLKERETYYDLIIVYTDGWAPNPDTEYLPNNLPVIWLLTASSTLPFNGNYGTYIKRD